MSAGTGEREELYRFVKNGQFSGEIPNSCDTLWIDKIEVRYWVYFFRRNGGAKAMSRARKVPKRGKREFAQCAANSMKDSKRNLPARSKSGLLRAVYRYSQT
jgi:hypothetical protein